MAKVLLLLLLGGSFVFGFVFAQEECPPPQPVPECLPSQTYTCDSETQYQCESNECGAGVRTRTKSYQCQDFYKPREATDLGCPGVYDCILDSTKVVNGPHYDAGQTIPGQQFRQCSSGSGWSSSYEFQCQGKCYPEPELQDLHEQTLSPSNVFDAQDKVKLPLNIGWKNNVEQQLSFSGAACQVSSYAYKVKQGDSVAVSGQVSGSEHHAVVGAGQCALNPAGNYSLEVSACAGETCNKPGTLSFSTSSAPQLLSPYDPDWESQNFAVAGTPTHLKWCSLPEAESYKLRVSIIQDDKQTCHPFFAAPGEPCGSTTIESEKGLPPFPSTGVLNPEFFDTKGIFTQDTVYLWEVASCLIPGGGECSSFSQQWKLRPSTQVLPQISQISPDNDPEGKTPLGFPLVLDWDDAPGINLYNYEVASGTNEVILSDATQISQSVPLGKSLLSLNTFYYWRVRGCSKFTQAECQGKWDTWTSPSFAFKITGEAPANLKQTPADGEGRILIPAKLSWQNKQGAGSYRYEVSDNSRFSRIISLGKIDAPQTERLLDFPVLKMDSDYWWRVRTCADSAGDSCGAWSSANSFHTFTLRNPSSPLIPSDKGELFTYQSTLAWNPVPGAKAYAYQIVYTAKNPPADEQDLACVALAGKEILAPDPNQVTTKPSIDSNLDCRGSYEWSVASCLDEMCFAKSTDAPATWTFTYVQPPPPSLPGLLVCGRLSDHPDTPFDEGKKCEFKHLFLLARNVVDFALWKLSLIALIAMTAFTGFTMYTSFGGMEVMTRVRSIWRAFGIGALILLFSWMFLNLVLGFLGFNINVFGRWHQLPL